MDNQFSMVFRHHNPSHLSVPVQQAVLPVGQMGTWGYLDDLAILEHAAFAVPLLVTMAALSIPASVSSSEAGLEILE